MTPMTPAAVMDEQRLQEIAAAPVVDPPYDPSCVECRRSAGKDVAGTTWQCVGHVYREREALRAEVRRLQQQAKEAEERAAEAQMECNCAVLEREAALAERDALFNSAWAVLNDERQANGEYVHAVTCSADRKKPIGCGGCSCQLGRRIKSLAAALTEARRVLLEASEWLEPEISRGPANPQWVQMMRNVAAVLAQEAQ